jgi:hypothetical protein
LAATENVGKINMIRQEKMKYFLSLFLVTDASARPIIRHRDRASALRASA